MQRLDRFHWILICTNCILAFFVAVLAFFLWISPYEYTSVGKLPVRINRLTGKTEILLALKGWTEVESKDRAKRDIFDELVPEQVEKESQK